MSASPVPTPKFTFAVAGDWGTVNSSAGLAVLQKIASSSYSPNFTIALGDLGYGDQNPNDWCSNFTKIYPRMVLITGNHDTLNSTFPITYGDGTTAIPKDALTSENAGNRSGFLDSITGVKGYVNACPAPSVSGINWVGSNVTSNSLHCLTTLSAPSCYGREYYFDYPASNPTMRFIMISAGICGTWFNGCWQDITYTGWKPPTSPAMCTTPPSGSEHYCWLKNRIDEAKNEGLWVAVALHKQCASDDGNVCESTFDAFNLGITEMGGVDLWLSGHAHSYQRSFQLTAPCSGSSGSIVSCSKANGNQTGYVRGAGTVVNIVGTGGASPGAICSQSCPNQSYFASLCGSNGQLPTVSATLGCPNGGDHGFSYFNITTNQISARYVSATSSFSDAYVIRVANPPGDYSVSANPVVPTPTLRRGLVLTNNTISIKLNSFGHFSGSLTLTANVTAGAPKMCSLSGCPSTTFSQRTVSLTDGNTVSSNLTISTSNSFPNPTPCGNSTSLEKYVVTVTATPTIGSVRHVTFSFYVYAKGDVNLNGRVDISDLSLVGGVYGKTSTSPGFNPNADLDKNGAINIVDLVIVGNDFGASC